jgi:ABC-2 type transport system permease protein
MMNTITKTIVIHFVKNIFQQKIFYFLLCVFFGLLLYAAVTGNSYLTKQNTMQQQYQLLIRKSWEANPDKHPHRMAHFGSFALRIKHPLSVFDYGLDNYAGNAVYLEAHKQNTVNYSEASFSTGMLRMGELSIAMLLQIILPLIIFFLGFGSIAADIENGALKIISSQGASNFQLLTGRTFGLWIISSLFFIPAFIVTGLLMALQRNDFANLETLSRLVLTTLLYIIFYWVVSAVTVIVSAKSNTAKNSLMKLLGIWLMMAIVLPKIVQLASSIIYPSPSKLRFESAIEKDIVKQGDSHNPDDPFFKKIKDSVLKKYGVSTVDSLPVNMGGIVGREGERLSAVTYVKHYNDLINLYRQQNAVSKWMGYINPFMMVKHNSMAMAGSDFESYINFQQQAEAYRYSLAQRMNELQTKYISNVKPKEGNHGMHVEKSHFAAFPDFNYQFLPLRQIISKEVLSLFALLFWLIVSWLALLHVSKTFKIISA